MMTKQPITKDTVIGDIIKRSPEAKEIIRKYFGGGCFTCSGMNVESLSFGAMMHNIDPETIIKEINELED